MPRLVRPVGVDRGKKLVRIDMAGRPDRWRRRCPARAAGVTARRARRQLGEALVRQRYTKGTQLIAFNTHTAGQPSQYHIPTCTAVHHPKAGNKPHVGYLNTQHCQLRSDATYTDRCDTRRCVVCEDNCVVVQQEKVGSHGTFSTQAAVR